MKKIAYGTVATVAASLIVCTSAAQDDRSQPTVMNVEDFVPSGSAADIASYLSGGVRSLVPSSANEGEMDIFDEHSYDSVSFSESFFNEVLDFSGVSVNQRAPATLITDRHVLMAGHSTQKPGTELLFYSPDGNRYARTVLASVRAAPTTNAAGETVTIDLAVGLLNEPLPDDIRVYPMTEIDDAVLETLSGYNFDVPGFVMFPGDLIANGERVKVSRLGPTVDVIREPTGGISIDGSGASEIAFRGRSANAGAGNVLWREGATSSYPTFLVVDGALSILSVVHTNYLDNSGATVTNDYNMTTINSLISTLNDRDYPAGSDWTICAGQNQVCDFAGTRTVLYGTGTDSIAQSMTGPVDCQTASFGTDPAPGEAKACYLSVASRPADDGWRKCAEGGTACRYTGTRTVRYGSANDFVEKSIDGPVYCSPGAFDDVDPAPGFRKSCALKALDPAAGAWEQCATEGKTCQFLGEEEVRYGAADSFIVASLDGPVTCGNAAFGRDPLPGTHKACSLRPRSTPEPTAWKECAQEGGTCVLNAPAQVRYGADESYVSAMFDTSITCSNATFGRDPLPGVRKACSVPFEEWTYCSKEHEQCAFQGERTVRYGADGTYVSAVMTGPIQCGNATFGGDPVRNVRKVCELLAD